MRPIRAIALLAGTVSCAAAQDVTLELLSTHDISALTAATAPVRVGTDPTGIAYDGNALYVSGENNSGPDLMISIAQITDFLDGDAAWAFTMVGGSERTAETGDGYGGIDWDPAFGLLSAYHDSNPFGAQFRTHNGTGPGTPLSLTAAALGGQGLASPCWDEGFNGSGYNLMNGTGPLAAIFDPASETPSGFGSSTIGEAGPLGLDPSSSTLPGLAAAFLAPPSGIIRYPRLIPQNGDFRANVWRAVDIQGPWFAARSQNHLVIAERTATNANAGEPIRVSAGPFTPTAGVDVAVLAEPICQEHYFLWNDRSEAPGTLSDVLRLTATDGADGELEIIDGGGMPPVFPESSGSYAISWDTDSQLLFISDNANHLVHVFEVTIPVTCRPGCNAADLAEDYGVLDLNDISAFVNGFTAQDPIADLAEPFETFDLNDITVFVTEFNAGCP